MNGLSLLTFLPKLEIVNIFAKPTFVLKLDHYSPLEGSNYLTSLHGSPLSMSQGLPPPPSPLPFTRGSYALKQFFDLITFKNKNGRSFCLFFSEMEESNFLYREYFELEQDCIHSERLGIGGRSLIT